MICPSHLCLVMTWQVPVNRGPCLAFSEKSQEVFNMAPAAIIYFKIILRTMSPVVTQHSVTPRWALSCEQSALSSSHSDQEGGNIIKGGLFLLFTSINVHNPSEARVSPLHEILFSGLSFVYMSKPETFKCKQLTNPPATSLFEMWTLFRHGSLLDRDYYWVLLS